MRDLDIEDLPVGREAVCVGGEDSVVGGRERQVEEDVAVCYAWSRRGEEGQGGGFCGVVVVVVVGGGCRRLGWVFLFGFMEVLMVGCWE